MSNDTAPEATAHSAADPAQTVLMKLVAMIEADFRVPAILDGDTVEILLWKTERILVRVTEMGRGTGHLKVRTTPEIRHETAGAGSRLTAYTEGPGNPMEVWYHAGTDVPKVEDDIRSHLTARLTYAGATHLIC